MGVEFEIELTGIPKRYKRPYRLFMLKLGNQVVERIRARTKKGKDANGKPFGQYADGSGDIDLVDTGAMLDSLHVVAFRDDEFILGVGASYAKYVDKRFNFFALSNEDMNFVAEQMANFYFNHLVDKKRHKKRRRRRRTTTNGDA